MDTKHNLWTKDAEEVIIFLSFSIFLQEIEEEQTCDFHPQGAGRKSSPLKESVVPSVGNVRKK